MKPNPPIGAWRHICPAEDPKSAREYVGALVFDALWRTGEALGLRQSWDATTSKFYQGLPVKPTAAGKSTAPAAAPAAKTTIPVYYSQRDSKIVRAGENQAGRMCFSTSCAMLLKDLKPGALSDSPNADDEYLQRVFDYGDTTEATAQVKALAHFGLTATFTTSLSLEQLDKLLNAGKRVAIGVLHHGPASRPTGGGHYLFVYGREAKGYRVHDPYGEMDLVAGGYINGNGKSLLYSRENLGKRWCVENAHSGYALYV